VSEHNALEQTTASPDDTIRCDRLPCPLLHQTRTRRILRPLRQRQRPTSRVDPTSSSTRPIPRYFSSSVLDHTREWDGNIVPGSESFVTAIGAGTTYRTTTRPVHHLVQVQGVDMVTVSPKASSATAASR